MSVPPDVVDADFPFVLLTGRGSASQWHTQTRTAKSPVLRKLYPESIYLEINPQDAERLGILPEQWVTVMSRRGTIRARAIHTHTVQPATVFLPMHYRETNLLTASAFDPYSHQPSYKACAVKVWAGG